MGYRETSTFLLSPYLFFCCRLFRLCITMHLIAIQLNSIGPVSDGQKRSNLDMLSFILFF
jgi:hypothetical protein